MQLPPVKAGKNLIDVQEMNRALVLRLIHQYGECSRSELSRFTGLRQTTITAIIGDLIRCGVVVESRLIKGARGRRSIGLKLNSASYRIIGIRLARQFIRAGLYDISGTQYTLLQRPISAENGVQAALDTMVQLVQELLNQTGAAQVLGIGVGIPGPYLRNDGIVAVIADFPGWESINISNTLAEAFHLPIYQEYDAYANALAEWWFGGRHKSVETLLAVYMEQGLGSGLIHHGSLYHGSQGIAGNIGHVSIDWKGIPCECGSAGCLRNYCTAKALIRDTNHSLCESDVQTVLRDRSSFSLDDIIQAANEGDEFCKSMLCQSARFLSYGLINIVYTYNPDKIVLSKAFSGAGEWYLNEIRRVFKQRLLPSIESKLSISFSRLEGDPVLSGTVALVIDWILQNPSLYLNL